MRLEPAGRQQTEQSVGMGARSLAPGRHHVVPVHHMQGAGIFRLIALPSVSAFPG
jgi:hypothetical protein